ncbi:MAG TPA: hypothetical protein VM308_07885 [Sphingomicrobium sp.]|nr:hypothetical protein [Sphingomicrobium sp.]
MACPSTELKICSDAGRDALKREYLPAALAALLLLEGCSSRPREFTPQLSVPASSQADFDAVFAECRTLFLAGKLDSSGRSASAGAGAAAGAATAAVGGTAAAAAGGYAGLAAAGATVVLLPVAILGGAWGMARSKRAKKERAIRTAMEGCLQERGYQVASWSKSVSKPVVVPPER